MLITSGSTLHDILQALSGTWLQETNTSSDNTSWQHLRFLNVDIWTATLGAGSWQLPVKPSRTSVLVFFSKDEMTGRAVNLNERVFKLDESKLVFYITIG